MSDKKTISNEEVYKSIGRLDESTDSLESEIKKSHENEEEIIGFLTFVGRIIKGLLGR